MNNKSLNKLGINFILPLISAAAVLKKESHLKKLLQSALDNKYDSSKIYEALLQTYLFAGFPSALRSIKIFREYFTTENSKEKFDTQIFRSRGVINCKKVYGKKFEKLIMNINSFSPELSEWLIIEGYGKTLGRKKLSLKEREICIVSILTVLQYEEQLYSHLLGALKTGNSQEEIKESLQNLRLIGEKGRSEYGIRILKKIISPGSLRQISN